MNVRIIKTARNESPMKEFVIPITEDKGQETNLICVFPEIEFQKIEGFGGAFTEAAADTIDKMSGENREKILKLYFDKNEGIGYNFGRVHINSCDFSLGNYTCVEEGDMTLSTFNVERDKKSIIPMIHDAMKYNDIALFASPWSPPAYMKTNGNMNFGGKLKPEFFELWAEYYVKFIEVYKKSGIDIGMISIQNEAKATQTWDSCVYTAEEERDFVKDYLGSKMEKLGVKVLFWDHNKERIIERAAVMLNDCDSAKYIHGLAFHWYSGDHFEQLSMFNKLYPDKSLVFSEGCYEYSLGESDTVKIGERYAHDMIGNFNNYCTAFCDWNLVLNEQGGPNHVGNFCDAPIMADTKTDTIHIHDSYYYIGHFSKYVQKGAVRIGSSKWTDKIDTVSFKNPNGNIVTVILNAGDCEMPCTLSLNGKMVELTMTPHSIVTVVFE